MNDAIGENDCKLCAWRLMKTIANYGLLSLVGNGRPLPTTYNIEHDGSQNKSAGGRQERRHETTQNLGGMACQTQSKPKLRGSFFKMKDTTMSLIFVMRILHAFMKLYFEIFNLGSAQTTDVLSPTLRHLLDLLHRYLSPLAVACEEKHSSTAAS